MIGTVLHAATVQKGACAAVVQHPNLVYYHFALAAFICHFHHPEHADSMPESAYLGGTTLFGGTGFLNVCQDSEFV